MMGIWFFVCLVGILGSAVITAHVVGLVLGAVWGFFSSLRHR
jgi:membrane associated rhomboid family serine protease